MASYSYVIPYNFDSNFDDVSVDEALDNYLRVQKGIDFELNIERNKAPIIKTTHALTEPVWKTMLELIDEAARRSSGFF